MNYVLFDLDGTISDPREGITGCLQYALAAMGIVEEDRAALEPFIGPPLLDSFMEGYGMDRAQADRAVEKYRERFSVTGLYENELYPGMADMLAGLCRDGFHLAVASSKPEVYVKKILKHFQIEEYFEAAVGSELNGERVNKDEVVEEALKRLFAGRRIDRDAVVMVGDRKYDVAGARAMGLKCIGVTYGYAQPGEMEACRPDWTAASVEELERVLRENEKEV